MIVWWVSKITYNSPALGWWCLVGDSIKDPKLVLLSFEFLFLPESVFHFRQQCDIVMEGTSLIFKVESSMKRLLSRPHLNFSTLNQSKGKIQDIRKIFHPKCFQINHSGRLAKNYFWVFLGRALQCWCSHVCGRCIHNTFSQHYPLAQWRSPSIFSGLNYDYTYDSKWMKTKYVKSDPKDTTVAPKTFLGEKSPPLAAVLHQRCECSKTHGVLAVGNFSILKRGLFRWCILT